jgi:hypothetical protein
MRCALAKGVKCAVALHGVLLQKASSVQWPCMDAPALTTCCLRSGLASKHELNSRVSRMGRQIQVRMIAHFLSARASRLHRRYIMYRHIGHAPDYAGTSPRPALQICIYLEQGGERS